MNPTEENSLRVSPLNINYRYIFGERCILKHVHRFTNRSYPFIVVVFVEEGIYNVSIGKETYSVHAGEAIVIPEFVRHEVFMQQEGVISWAHVTAHISDRDILSYFSVPYVFRGNDAAKLGENVRTLAELSGIESAGDRLKAGTNAEGSKDVYAKLDVETMLDKDVRRGLTLKAGFDARTAEILQVILSRAALSTGLGLELFQWNAEVSQYIHSNLRKKLTLEMLAEEFHLSVRGFTKKFRNSFGQSPIDFILDEKIRYSTWMLLNGESIKKIALDLGFTDSYYYSRQFKKRMGTAPAQYRNEYFSG